MLADHPAGDRLHNAESNVGCVPPKAWEVWSATALNSLFVPEASTLITALTWDCSHSR